MVRFKVKWLCLIVCLLPVMLLFSGCKRGYDDKSRRSLGVDDGIEGFLFNFDEREEVKSLVRFKSSGQLPVSVTWFYDRERADVIKEEDMEAEAVMSTDPEKIEEIYYGLSNTIVLGIASTQRDPVCYFVSFTLPDGQKCRFNFTSEISIHLNEHNYIAETDGSLWRVLSMDGETPAAQMETEEISPETETAAEAEVTAAEAEEIPPETETEAETEGVPSETETLTRDI